MCVTYHVVCARQRVPQHSIGLVDACRLLRAELLLLWAAVDGLVWVQLPLQQLVAFL